MNRQKIFHKMELEMEQAIKELGSIFKYEMTGSDVTDTYQSIRYKVTMEFGNCNHSHGITLTHWVEDGHLAAITPFNLIMQFYLDFAMQGLADKYLI